MAFSAKICTWPKRDRATLFETEKNVGPKKVKSTHLYCPRLPSHGQASLRVNKINFRGSFVYSPVVHPSPETQRPMPPIKPMPRAKFKRVVREKLRKRKNLKNDSTDLLVYMNYMFFMKTLIREAKKLQQQDQTDELSVVHINNVRSAVLKKFRG